MAEILTNNAMFSSFMIVLIVFALGDIVGKITKGKLSGMCVLCGCYVELRALKIGMRCADIDKKW